MLLVLLMMVVASSVVDDWLVVGWLGLDGGCVGFWIVHGGEREVETEGEEERQKLERGRDGIGLCILLYKYIILMYCIGK